MLIRATLQYAKLILHNRSHASLQGTGLVCGSRDKSGQLRGTHPSLFISCDVNWFCFFCKVDNKGLARADDLSSPKTVISAETCLNLLTLCPRYIGEKKNWYKQGEKKSVKQLFGGSTWLCWTIGWTKKNWTCYLLNRYHDRTTKQKDLNSLDFQ